MTKEEKTAYDKARYQANKEKIKAQNKAWYYANHGKAKAWRKAYREANREASRKQTKAWNKVNPEKRRQYREQYRALKYKTQIEPINEKIVYLRDGWKCQHCKKRVNKRLKWPNPMCASLDHIVPLSKGGTHTYNNVQLAHLSCNQSKQDGISEYGEQLRIC